MLAANGFRKKILFLETNLFKRGNQGIGIAIFFRIILLFLLMNLIWNHASLRRRPFSSPFHLCAGSNPHE